MSMFIVLKISPHAMHMNSIAFLYSQSSIIDTPLKCMFYIDSENPTTLKHTCIHTCIVLKVDSQIAVVITSTHLH